MQAFRFCYLTVDPVSPEIFEASSMRVSAAGGIMSRDTPSPEWVENYKPATDLHADAAAASSSSIHSHQSILYLYVRNQMTEHN